MSTPKSSLSQTLGTLCAATAKRNDEVSRKVLIMFAKRRIVHLQSGCPIAVLDMYDQVVMDIAYTVGVAGHGEALSGFREVVDEDAKVVMRASLEEVRRMLESDGVTATVAENAGSDEIYLEFSIPVP